MAIELSYAVIVSDDMIELCCVSMRPSYVLHMMQLCMLACTLHGSHKCLHSVQPLHKNNVNACPTVNPVTKVMHTRSPKVNVCSIVESLTCDTTSNILSIANLFHPFTKANTIRA